MDTFGRRVPSDWAHVDKYPMRLMARPSPSAPFGSEWQLTLPQYRLRYDQGQEGACVGFSCSWMMSILNRRLYNARALYQEAQLVDEWPETPPEEGTSVRAAMDVLRKRGHWRWWRKMFSTEPIIGEGIAENRWATSADEVRTAIFNRVPVVLGINWYASFSRPEQVRTGISNVREWWIGRDFVRDRITGGHAICVFGMSDRRQAVRLVNTWGLSYPHVWLPYEALDRLIREDGEAALVTDRL